MSYGTSTVAATEWVCRRIKQIDPRFMLDVGCGWGRWGFLAREFIDVWEGRSDRNTWQLKLIGIDVNPNNHSPIHDFVYNAYVNADVRDYEMWSDAFDLVVACDVIEHLPKDDGLQVLSRMQEWAENVIVTIPLGSGWLRDGRPDNPAEAHLARWEWEDLASVLRIVEQQEVTLDWVGEAGLRYGMCWSQR